MSPLTVMSHGRLGRQCNNISIFFLSRFQEAEPIMIWLQRQRYSDHGFSGAQVLIRNATSKSLLENFM